MQNLKIQASLCSRADLSEHDMVTNIEDRIF